MKSFIVSALVVALVLLNLSWAEEQATQEAAVGTTAHAMFDTFCRMSPEEQETLLKCLAEKEPDVAKDIEQKGYNATNLPNKVCNTDSHSFPPELLLYVGKSLPFLSVCLPSPAA
uniref:Putative secreted protein n=1 Tax=Amblyomma parvum TaxID=251391 RepID=A0A023G0E6_AMBPA